jgi:hypothetical protein
VRYETVTVPVGEVCGRVDWEHPTAKDKPPIWREAEENPDAYLYNGWAILRLCMYDGWPYWKPRPAIQFIGPLNSAEWNWFDSYGVQLDSIEARGDRAPRGQRP